MTFKKGNKDWKKARTAFKKGYTPWNKIDEKDILELANKGMTAEEISTKMNNNLGSIKKIFRKNKIDYIKKNRGRICEGKEYKCEVCNYKWKTIKKETYPSTCPACYSPAWDFGMNINCYCCDNTILLPNIHHKDRNRKNNSKENRIALCITCHRYIHSGSSEKVIRRFKAKFNDYSEAYKKAEELKRLIK